jgi:uncharacterized protein YjdB
VWNGSLYFVLITLLFCCIGNRVAGAVAVTAASNGINICSNKALGGTAPAFTTLSTITIAEGANGDISGASGGTTNTIVINAPGGWQFNNTALPSFSFVTGANITSVTGSITSSTLTVYITANNTNNSDQVFINGLQVQATSATSVGGNIYASSVSGVAGIATGVTGTNFATLSLTAPLSPSITIVASPSGAICPGTPVTFTPTAVNGGTSPSFQWLVNGSSVAAGSGYITSTLAAGNSVSCILTSSLACVTSTTANSNIIVMTINPAPAAITGTTNACQGATSTLSSITTGGTWSSSATGVATVNATGVVAGVSAGTTTISYTAAGCASIANFYVNLPPVAPLLSPTSATVCDGSVLSITALGTPAPPNVLIQNFNGGITPWTVDNSGGVGAVSGSEWKSCGDGYVNEQGLYHSLDNSAFVMSNSDTSGSASYTSSQLISPVFSLTGYSSAALSFQTAYEAWTGDINVKVDISTDGGASWTTLRNYLGSSIGTRISFATDVFSLNSYLGQSNLRLRFYYYCHWGYYWAIDNVSVTGTSSLAAPTWSPTTYLFLDSLGTVPYTGSAVATVYMKPSGVSAVTPASYTATSNIGACMASAVSTVTINPTPGVIVGNANICIASISSLTDAYGSGTWASSNTAVATVGSATGVVTGVVLGTATISYIASTGCAATVVVTVNTTPAPIGGTLAVCPGSSTSLTSSTAGGAWSSMDPGVATVGLTNGVVSPIAVGTTTIIYSLGAGCTTTQIVTVNTVPPAIAGAGSVCMGQDITLSDAASGGAWSSNNSGIASAAATTGLITGVGSGTATITYAMPGVGCYAVKSVTVNLLGAITGATNVCAGQTITLSNTYSGGTWSSGASSIAPISAVGVVTGSTPGTSVISYTMPMGCTAAYPFTVNPLPNAITGPANICLGLTMTLSSSTAGGSWSGSNTAVATVGSSNGGVYGVAIGTAIISYVLPTGCYVATAVTVNPLPSSISGLTTMCSGGTTTLTDVTTGGTWSSSNTGNATVGSTTGIVTGGIAGPAGISYTLPTGCYVTQVMTVNPLPVNITGPSSVCVGYSITLADATSGGVWGSSNATVASVGAASGLMVGNAVGNTTISYTLPTGCMNTTVVSVNSLPSAITGTAAVCVAQTTSLSSATSGGTWSGGSPYASVTPSTGVVTGSVAGNTYITYTLSTGCFVTKLVTVNPLPSSITGTLNICAGALSSLSDASAGGTWISNTTPVATIGSANGVLSGVAAGITLVRYILPTGCVASTTATVNALPAVITGPTSVCVAATITLDDATTGGTWSCSGTTVASINAATGVLTGIGTGTTTVTYSVASGCRTTAVVTVNGLPGAITGANTVCQNASVVLSSTSPGGTWTSGNISIATVSSGTGIVTGGGTAGTVTITYTLSTGCYAIKQVTVNQSPAAITGIASVCSGNATSLGSATSGGTWTSSSTTIATVGSATGIVNGISNGSTLIYYTLANGCAANKLVTVNAQPAAIIGSTAGCTATTTTLSSATSGGTWSSSNTAIATIGSSTGVMSGVVVGTARITYMLSSGCFVSTIVTINTSPDAVSGPSSVCVGSAAVYSDATAAGSWSGSNVSVASIGSASGFFTGYAAGAVTISYTLSSGCYAAMPITVNTLPAAISGVSSICQGLTVSFGDATTAGTWTSSNSSVASIDATTGLATANAPGIAAIYYTLSSGCAVSKILTVNATSTVITGSLSICQASTSTLTNTVGGGTWSSSNTIVASVGSGTGVVSALGVGTSVITYSTGTGCFAVATVTVNISPAAIIGLSSVCQGNAMLLSCTTTGGIWSSSNTAIATVGTGGVVAGVSPGTATISYGISAVCSVTRTVTVNAVPASISGASALCTGGSLALSDGTPGGIWSSSNTSVASIGSSTGVLIAGGTGTVTVSYILGNGCTTTATFTVGGTTPIAGINTLCVGTLASLSNTAPGGSWSSNTTAVATIGSATGVAAGMSAGVATITYAIGTGCRSAMTVTVYPAPAGITGGGTMCAGSTLTLADATTGGTWSSGDNTIATVGPSSGIVTGVTGGTVDISYTTTTGCVITKTITVNALPPAINGTGNVCLGQTITMADMATGGTWSSSDVSVVTIGLSDGIAMGYSLSTATITYTLPTGCYTTQIATVNALPAAITGAIAVCQAQTTTLSDITAGGTWSSSNIAIATVGMSTGVVSGFAGGIATISYTAPTGCYVTRSISVNTLPSPITGTLAVCAGATTTVSNATAGGTWSSSAPTIATVTTTSGMVSGTAAGTSTITYTPVTGCITTSVVTVLPLPSAIAGNNVVCPGASATLSSALGTGSWASSNATIATVGTSGIVSGVMAGSVVITYTGPNTCRVTYGFTVNPLPAAISGSLNLCVGFTSSLSDAPTGGSWSSTNAGIASVGSSSGVVSGVSSGTTAISYSLSTGCFVTSVITVNALTPISGPNSLCVGTSTTLSDATGSSTWSSSNTSIATIGASTGVVSGIAEGSATITYSYLSGCYTTMVVSVNLAPTAITGISSVCVGSAITLSNAATGGTWSCSSAGSIGSTSGILSGISAGTVNVTYSSSAGCTTTATLNVYPAPADITGISTFCVGYVSTLSDATPGGVWISSGTSVATIGSSSGIVTGLTTGASLVSYRMSTGCMAEVFVIVNALTPINGITSVCKGSTTTLTNISSGPTWVSSNPSVATIGSSSGIVAGVAAGTTTITCNFGAGCNVTKVVTVMPLPASIVGPSTVCQSPATTLTDATGAGTWSSSSIYVATIGSTSGVVSGVAAGVTTVSYILPTGCFVTTQITVNPLPASISGGAVVCAGLSSTLSNATAGGTWSSSNAAIASIDGAAAIVTGISAGSTMISYMLPTGCFVTRVVTVNPLPTLITGPSTVCIGLSATVSSASVGGTWSSSNATIAAIGSSSGIISGLAVGSSIITYSLPTGCVTTQVVMVASPPSAVTGAAAICVGSMLTLADVSTGGSWSAGATSVVSVGLSTGIVTGVNAGTAVVTYSVAAGCFATALVTVNPLPSTISGSSSVCVGSSVTLSSAPAGTWGSGAGGTASINSAGVLAGVSVGTAFITYTLPTGCSNIITVAVNPLPAGITGADAVCVGSAITLSDGTSGGSWSSTAVTISVGASGVITGVTTGGAVVTYTLPTGCFTTKAITINPLPAAIVGSSVVCQGNSATLTDGTPGGAWSSGDATIVIASGSGVVSGVTAGTVSISYTLSTGCFATRAFTVNPQLPITGSALICLGAVTPLSNSVSGGVWTSSNTSLATIGSVTGMIVGASLGMAVISYSLPTGCASSIVVTVYPVPTAITGAMSLCQGRSTTLSNATGGGSWSSGATSIATVGASSGDVSGVGAGTVNVFYVLSTGCSSSAVLTVNPLQPITGPGALCMGTSAAFLNAVPGGTWSSSTSGVVTVGTSSGIGAAHTAGTAIISYMLSTGCLATMNVTVNALPSVYNVTGGGAYCIGGTGVPVGLGSSSIGVTYKLYKDTTNLGGLIGTGSALDFGLQTAAGTYTVIAISSVTGCYQAMNDSAVVSVSGFVTPAVSIASFIHDSACFAMPTVFYAYASGGGSAPVYSWRVNGVLTAGTSSNYTFVPAAGDVVSCTMISNAVCRTTDSASASIAVTIVPLVTPSVSLMLTPNDTVCEFTSVALTPVNVNGGYAPSFAWIKNGMYMATSATYSYTPADGDAVHCVMTSNAICRTADTVSSINEHFTVLPYVAPSIAINATPSLDITTGENITFSADIAGGGAVSLYQWYINTAAIPGATSSSLIATSLNDRDSVSCVVTSSGMCALSEAAHVIVRVYPLGVAAANSGMDPTLMPNPNKGSFSVKGVVNINTDRLQLTVTDVIGRVIYTTRAAVIKNNIDTVLTLPDSLANGIYLLTVGEGEHTTLIRFAISH